jgi:diguanylate cyclase (GGDEF)-like protein
MDAIDTIRSVRAAAGVAVVDGSGGVATRAEIVRTQLLEQARRRLVMEFSTGSAILGLCMLPLFLFDVFGLRGTVEMDSIAYAVASGTGVQFLAALWTRSGRDVTAAGIVTVAIQTLTIASAAILLRNNEMLSVSALMFAIVPMMLAGSVLDPRSLTFTAIGVGAVDVAAAAWLFPQHGWDVLIPPVLILCAGSYIIRSTAKVAFDLDARDADHRAEEARLELEACTDSLTGLFNRRGFLIAAESELELAHRLGMGVTIIYLDLDGMKDINDARGHLHGDVALRSAARMIADVLRSSDLVGRIGGDEFAVFALQMPGAEIENFPGRLEDVMARHNDEHSDDAPVWLSWGMVRTPKGDDRGLEELLRVADNLMYEAKHANRLKRRPGGALVS